MQPSELAEIGRELYGKHWQTRMARVLEVDPRTVRRWAAGEYAVPNPVQAWLRCESRKCMKCE